MSLEKASDTLQPMAFGSFRNWLRLLWSNGGVDPPYLRRALFVSAVSGLTTPFRWYERLRYAEVSRAQEIKPPIFILGHWRSGTTHLHYLMCQDKNFGYPTTFQTIAPELFLGSEKLLKPLMVKLAPSKRMMDNMALSLDGPQEEEFAISNVSPYSFYHHWSFPRQAREYFERYALFQGVAPEVIARWKEIYLQVLRKATYKMGGRQLLIKNPAHTGHVKILLELFPHAKFIHVYRDPYRVFPSTRHFYKKILAIARFQDIQLAEVEANILDFYREIMQKFLAEKSLIPLENFVEVKFEALEANPLAELRRIYEHLQLPGFEGAAGAFRDYLALQAGYQKNEYPLKPEDIEKVNQHWQFAVKEWGYAPQTASPARLQA